MQISVDADTQSTKRGIFQQKPPKNAVVVKSVLDAICKQFRDTAMRENFNLKPGKKMEKTRSNNRGNYTHQYNEVKEKL